MLVRLVNMTSIIRKRITLHDPNFDEQTELNLIVFITETTTRDASAEAPDELSVVEFERIYSGKRRRVVPCGFFCLPFHYARTICVKNIQEKNY